MRRDSDFDYLSKSPAVWSIVYPDGKEFEAVRFIRERTSPSDPVFAGEGLHREASWNDLRAYWLLDRQPAVFYYEFEPAITPHPEIQQTMIDDLMKKKIRWALIRHNEWPDPVFTRLHTRQSDLLDRFLADQFRTAATFGGYEVRVAP